MVNGLERQTSDEKLVLLDDDGKSLKKVNYLVNADSDSEAEEVFDETACFMASTSYKVNKSGSGAGIMNNKERLILKT
ncbi:hypothetical protein Tco_0915516, partial [Tanacetum coccineum]